MSRHGGVMDVLVVDAEGADVDLLATLPLDRLRPRVIVFEAKHEISWGGSEAPSQLGRLLASLREGGGYDLASRGEVLREAVDVHKRGVVYREPVSRRRRVQVERL